MDNPIERIRDHFKKRRENRNAVTEAFSKGYILGIGENMEKLKRIENKVKEVIELSTENEKLLQKNYQDNLAEVEQGWSNKCGICKQGMDAERKRVLELRRDFLDRQEQFLEIYNKLIKYIAIMDTSHESLLTNLSRLHTSQKYLEGIKDEADTFMGKSTKLIDHNI